MKKLFFLGVILINSAVIAAPWQQGISAYDINGKPYTGKAYINEVIWSEIDFENGNPVRIFTDGCAQGSCETREILKGIPYIRKREDNEKILDGLFRKEVQKGPTEKILGQEGLYNNGVPDGLHKVFDEKGVRNEIMYDKGRILWEKKYGQVMPDSPYMLLKTDMQETVYGNGLITDTYYDQGQKVLEIKKLPDERLAEISLYEKGKMLMRQRFRKDGTSLAENFVNNTKKDLLKNQIYHLSEHFGQWEEEIPYDYVPFHGFFRVIAGKRAVCLGIIGQPDQIMCTKSMDSNPMDMNNLDILSSAQKQFLYENPSAFFKKNELNLDLSDVGLQDIRKLNADSEQQMRQLMEAMTAGMQGMMEGMVEGLGAASEDEAQQHVKSKIDDAIKGSLSQNPDNHKQKNVQQKSKTRKR